MGDCGRGRRARRNGRRRGRRLSGRSRRRLAVAQQSQVDRLQLGWDRINAANPRLVYCSVTGFGRDGPYQHRPAYEQVAVPKDMIGDQAMYLQENMAVKINTHEGVPVSVELPPRVVLEVVEADPVVKGQTASSSFKPAILSNGQRVMVPPHIQAGTRVVVMTDDGSYVERAKD